MPLPRSHSWECRFGQPSPSSASLGYQVTNGCLLAPRRLQRPIKRPPCAICGRVNVRSLRPLSRNEQTSPLRSATSVSCHVWTAPGWQELSSRMQHWSVQPCVRPVGAVHMTAGQGRSYRRQSPVSGGTRSPPKASRIDRLETKLHSARSPEHALTFGIRTKSGNGYLGCCSVFGLAASWARLAIHASYSGAPRRGGASAGSPPIQCGISAICPPAVRSPAHDDSDKHARQRKADLIVVVPFAFSRVRMTSLRSVAIDETADQPGKRLMLGACFASSEKVAELDFGRRSAGSQVGFV